MHPSLLVSLDSDDEAAAPPALSTSTTARGAPSPAPSSSAAVRPARVSRHKLDNRAQAGSGAAPGQKRAAAAPTSATVPPPTKRAKAPVKSRTGTATSAAADPPDVSARAIVPAATRAVALSASSSSAGEEVPLLPGQIERVVHTLHAAGVLPTHDALRRAFAALTALTKNPLPPLPPPVGALAPPIAATEPQPIAPRTVVDPPAQTPSLPLAAAAAKESAEAPSVGGSVDGAGAEASTSTVGPLAALQAKEALSRALAHLEARAARPLSFELQRLLADCARAERFATWTPPDSSVAVAAPLQGASTAISSVPAGEPPAPAAKTSRPQRQSRDWWGAVLDGDGSSDNGSDAEDDAEAGGALAERAAEAAADGRIDEHVLESIGEAGAYESPLLALRAYRLKAGYTDGGARQLTDEHARACLNPTLPLCRFELQGECRAPDCNGQHRRDFLTPAEQMPAELSRYAAGLPQPPHCLEARTEDADTAVTAEEASARDAALQAGRAHATMSVDAPAAEQLVVRIAAQHVLPERGQAVANGADANGADAGAADTPSTRIEGGGGGRGGEASQLQLLHAALRVNPQPSLLAGDLSKQLAPVLSRYRSADAAALEAAALDGAPPPAEVLPRGPVQALRPTVPFASSTPAEAVALTAASAVDDGSNGRERYWSDHGERDGSVDDSALAEQLVELGAAACWRRVLTLRLGGDARSAGHARRRSAMRVLSRCLERRADCAALWATHLALYGMDSSSSELREQIDVAVRHAPCSLLLWEKLASLQPTLSARTATHIRALHTLCGEVGRKRCTEAALLPAALTLLRELASARVHRLAERVADVLLAGDAYVAAEARLLAQDAAKAHGVRRLPPIPRIAPLLPAAALGALWLARVELVVDGSVAAASTAADELLLIARGSGHTREATEPYGCMLPWQAWDALKETAGSVRSLLDDGMRAVSLQMHSSEAGPSAIDEASVAEAGAEADLKQSGDAIASKPIDDDNALPSPRLAAVRNTSSTLSTSVDAALPPASGSDVTSRAAGEARAAALWLLRLNLVGLEIALGDAAAADSACRGFLAEDYKCAGARCERSWRLWASVQRNQPGDAGEALIWQARLSEQPVPMEQADDSLVSAVGRFELWHALLLSAAEDRVQAVRLVACALSECQPPNCDTAAALVFSWCKPMPQQLPSAAEAAAAPAEPSWGDSFSLDASMVAHATALLRAWLASSLEWQLSNVRETTYMYLLGAFWMQLTSTCDDVRSVFEAGVNAVGRCAEGCGGCRAILWMRYLAWSQQPGSGVNEGAQLALLRRFIERRDETRRGDRASDAQLTPSSPRALYAANRASLTLAATAVQGGSANVYDEREDAQLSAVLATEPARSFFYGRVPGLVGGDAAGALLGGVAGSGLAGRDSTAVGPRWGGRALWVWDAEAQALAVQTALRRASTHRRWELGSARSLPSALILVAAHAAGAGAVRQARTALAQALRHSPSSEDAWILAIWLEASGEHWEAAATLAHVGVANHHGSVTLWQQA